VVLSGTLLLEVDGQPSRTIKAGQAFFIPAGVVHAGKNVGKGKAVVLATYVVEKGKPVASMVK
jgi:quercetin dioxygenase-like cupin family protein